MMSGRGGCVAITDQFHSPHRTEATYTGFGMPLSSIPDYVNMKLHSGRIEKHTIAENRLHQKEIFHGKAQGEH